MEEDKIYNTAAEISFKLKMEYFSEIWRWWLIPIWYMVLILGEAEGRSSR